MYLTTTDTIFRMYSTRLICHAHFLACILDMILHYMLRMLAHCDKLHCIKHFFVEQFLLRICAKSLQSYNQLSRIVDFAIDMSVLGTKQDLLA